MQKYLCRSIQYLSFCSMWARQTWSMLSSMFLGSLWVPVKGWMDPQASWLETRMQGAERLDKNLGCGARRGLVGSDCVPSSGDGAVGI